MGTVQKKITYLLQMNDGDYTGAVTVDRERVEHDDPPVGQTEHRSDSHPGAGAHEETSKHARTGAGQRVHAYTGTHTYTDASAHTNADSSQSAHTRHERTHPPRHESTNPRKHRKSARQSNLEEKRFMLNLINEERRKAGVPEVTLGSNRAAQLHAEASLAGCFSSHWGMDGLKPYMRYTLAGGQQSNGENLSGSSATASESMMDTGKTAHPGTR